MKIFFVVSLEERAKIGLTIFFGHQLSCIMINPLPKNHHNEVDGKSVPVPHLVLFYPGINSKFFQNNG